MLLIFLNKLIISIYRSSKYTKITNRFTINYKLVFYTDHQNIQRSQLDLQWRSNMSFNTPMPSAKTFNTTLPSAKTNKYDEFTENNNKDDFDNLLNEINKFNPQNEQNITNDKVCF